MRREGRESQSQRSSCGRCSPFSLPPQRKEISAARMEAQRDEPAPFPRVEIGRGQVYELEPYPMAKGGFGYIYRGCNEGARNDKVAVKLQKKNGNDVPQEWQVYEELGGIPGLPKIHGKGEKDGYFFMVMDLLGGTLLSLNRKMTSEEAAWVAVEAIKILKEVHSKKYIHGDVKPENLLYGLDSHSKSLFMVDFGLAVRWEESGKHVHYKQELGFSGGTSTYASVNALLGRTLSRRDDLESLAYSLAFLLRGSLPWQCKNDNHRQPKAGSKTREGEVSMTREEKHFLVCREKAKTKNLFLDCHPTSFVKFFDYAVNLEFDEEPDYEKCIFFFGVDRFQYDSIMVNTKRLTTNLLRTGRPAAQWITVYNHRQPMAQRCHYDVPEEFLDTFINKDLKRSLFISSVASCNKKWVLISDAGSGFQSQIHKLSPDLLPKNWIEDQWNNNFYITAVAGSSDGKYLVVMAKDHSCTKQLYTVGKLFPSSWVNKKKKDGFFVTSIATSKGCWAVIMSRDFLFVDQVIEVDFGFPVEGFRRRLAAGYIITAAAATMDQVAVVMSKLRNVDSFQGQVVQRSSSFPSKQIKEQQDKDFYVSSICHGRTVS